MSDLDVHVSEQTLSERRHAVVVLLNRLIWGDVALPCVPQILKCLAQVERFLDVVSLVSHLPCSVGGVGMRALKSSISLSSAASDGDQRNGVGVSLWL